MGYTTPVSRMVHVIASGLRSRFALKTDNDLIDGVC